MRNLIVFTTLLLLSIATKAQTPFIKSMKWGTDLKIQLELNNDSLYILDVKELHHSTGIIDKSAPVYYPASLSANFIESLKGKKIR
jgi:hypothetical protein